MFVDTCEDFVRQTGRYLAFSLGEERERTHIGQRHPGIRDW